MKNRILREEKSYPLDYIMNAPSEYFGENIEERYKIVKRENASRSRI